MIDRPNAPFEPQDGLTRQHARDVLEGMRAPMVPSARDRRVHALATALSGILLGGYLAAMSGLIDRRSGWHDGAVPLYLLLVGAVAVWQQRAARTIPLGARRLGNLALCAAIGISLVLVVIGHVIWGRDVPPAYAVALGLATAAPMVLAGRRIAQGGR